MNVMRCNAPLILTESNQIAEPKAIGNLIPVSLRFTSGKKVNFIPLTKCIEVSHFRKVSLISQDAQAVEVFPHETDHSFSLFKVDMSVAVSRPVCNESVHLRFLTGSLSNILLRGLINCLLFGSTLEEFPVLRSSRHEFIS